MKAKRSENYKKFKFGFKKIHSSLNPRIFTILYWIPFGLDVLNVDLNLM